MAKMRKFKCSKCGRRFSMAAHLARHQNAAHGAKKELAVRKRIAKKKVAKRARRKMVKRAARPVRRARAAISGETTALIRQIQAYRNERVAERNQAAAQIAAIDRALAALAVTGRTAAARTPRGQRPASVRRGSLKFYIGRVLRSAGTAVAVKDVTTAVLKAGYKSKSKALPHSVGVALSEMPNVVKVARGRYRLR